MVRPINRTQYADEKRANFGVWREDVRWHPSTPTPRGGMIGGSYLALSYHFESKK